MSSGRYERLFARLRARDEIAFVPFSVLGDPDLERSEALLVALAEAGADALELGIPFSDPVADGPTIQRADLRALAAGATVSRAWELLARLRRRLPEIPMGLLVYANLLAARGVATFYAEAAAAGVDSVLVADVPSLEAEPFVAAARAAGVQPVFIAPPNASPERLRRIAALGEGYTYVVTRAGVTGADEQLSLQHDALFAALEEAGGAPPVFGFGIARPEHVAAARRAGAAGAISGSAVVALIERHLDDPAAAEQALRTFVAEMKAATRPDWRAA